MVYQLGVLRPTRLVEGALPSRRQGGGTVRGRARPFSGTSVDVLAKWVDRQIDISQDAAYIQAPEALKAIHDREFATPAATFDEFRWRIQYLAELGIGRLLRSEMTREEAIAAAMGEKLA